MQDRRFITRYVALGDSLTEGTYDWGHGDRNAGFTYVLAEYLRRVNPGLHYRNLGVNGARVADLFHGQVAAALADHPNLMTVLIGANDLAQTPVDTFRELFGRVLHQLRTESDAIIVVGNIPDVGRLLPVQYGAYRQVLIERLREFNAVIAAAASVEKVSLVDLYNHPAPGDPANISSDGIHPNPAGYRILANEFAQALSKIVNIDTMNPIHPSVPQQ
ncbi:MAG: hypothetical protein NVS4B8_20410 [Herpetosiphon sp.]